MTRFICWFALACVAFPLSAQNRAQRWVARDPVPQWVWAEDGPRDGQRIFLCKDFTLQGPVQSARLYTTCDNQMTLWINGKRVARSEDWPYPIVNDVSDQLRVGGNRITIEATNDGGIAALVFKLVVEDRRDQTVVVTSDVSWQMTTGEPTEGWTGAQFDATGWNDKLVVLKPLGGQPWGIPAPGRRGASANVVASDQINVPDGFRVELVYRVPSDQQGSWVSLTTGPAGQLIACDQGDKGAFFVGVEESSDGPQAVVTPIEVSQPDSSRRLSGAQGLLWADDALWFHKNGGHLYRLIDSSGDGQLDQAEQLPSQTGGGEHGNHALILTAGGEGIYMAGGNHAPLAELASSSVQSWQEDLLLPRLWDARGHARGRLAPGGWVTRLDPQTFGQHLVCIGFRNEYDITLNRYGDMFTFDADMEWDLGAPWYRPTRICLVASGGDYGWRSGTGKWPTYYEDSLPPVVEIGPGSPTGVVSGSGASFPARYQEAIFALDWTFGTIYAIHLKHAGSGYTGASEPFVTGSPLPVTDAVIGSDGALYFTVGGRGTQSALYRVRYEGRESTAEVGDHALPAAIAKARSQRRELEQYHGQRRSAPAAQEVIELAWPHLSSTDRFLRSAARVAIESQSADQWSGRALAEGDPQAAITSAVALARSGQTVYQRSLLKKLSQIDTATLTDSQLLGWFRAVALTCIRLGQPDEQQRQVLVDKLDPMLPHANDDANTELVRLLTYLESPSVIEKTLTLIRDRKPPAIPDWLEMTTRNAGYGGTVRSVLENHPPSREVSYALMLRNLRDGWTVEQRREYFEFLNVAAKASGGASYPGYLSNIRDEALSHCSDAERVALQDITGEQYDPVPDFEIHPIVGPGQVWTAEQARSRAGNRFGQADFQRGRSLYFAASCGKCHRFAGLGGSVGPDLTTIPLKFDVDYLIEHIIDPNKVISDQYQSSSVLTDDGRLIIGLMSEADGKLVIYPADAKAEPITLDADEVVQVKPSSQSQMPKGLIDGLNADELRDLLAYLMSGGDRNNRRVYGRR